MWDRIRRFFRNSETIFWARAQTFIGLLAGIATYVDPQLVAPVLPAKWLPVYLLVNGVLTEYLRRRRGGTGDSGA